MGFPQFLKEIITAKVVRVGIKSMGGFAILGGDVTGPSSANVLFGGQLTSSPGAVLTTLDSVAKATYKSMIWFFQATKGTNTYTSIIYGGHDATTAVFTEIGPNLAPGAGTYDFTTDVNISGTAFRLQVTPSTGGWTFKTRQMSRLTA